MIEPSPRTLTLELPPDVAFLPTAASAAENAAQVYGLDQGGALKLALAVEEFHAYLCRHGDPAEPLRLSLTSGGTFVRASFRLRASEVSLRALNFAASVSLDDGGDDHCELGLLVAARTTDRCSLESLGAGAYLLQAEVDRAYPEEEPLRAPHRLSEPVSIVEASNDADNHGQSPAGLLRHAALLAAGRYPARACPSSFSRPTRFADMVASGQYHALLVADGAGRPAGLICWRGSGPRAVVFSGPYVFDDGEDRTLAKETARLLTERFLSRVARTEALCAFSERATADVPQGWFERLGQLTLHGGGAAEVQPALFRHLREDVGGAVWAHPDLVPFLEDAYDRLAFSRDILKAVPHAGGAGPGMPKHSLLATALDRRRGLALLRPLLDGQDFAANLAAHVAELAAQKSASGCPPDILLHLDLSEPWQAARHAEAAACGFAPRLILPHAGASDLLVCQHVPADR